MISYALALPEIFLAGAGMFLLLFGAVRGEKSTQSITLLTVLSFGLTAGLLMHGPEKGLAFDGVFISDPFAHFIKYLILGTSALVLLASQSFWKKAAYTKPEYPVLILFATLGMMLMVSANNLIALYVGLELQNLALYVLTAFQRTDRRVSEAGMKYFTLGALSSGILLFGLSLIYGYTGTLSYEGVANVLKDSSHVPEGLAAGLAFALAGLAFKISAVPFHMWAPDVYEGAPTPVTSYLAAAPKVAAMALIARFLTYPFAGAEAVWHPLVLFLAVASMLLGGFAGLIQDNIKRLMAYSGLINIGTILVGLLAFGTKEASVMGIEGMLLYMSLYVFGVLAVFAVLLSLSKEGKGCEKIEELKGLARTQPLLALCMGAALFSLAGIPPFAGFFGKYVVFMAAVKADMTWLAVLGIVASVVAAAYYLRIVKVMFFDAPGEKESPLEAAPDKQTRLVVVLTGLVVTFFVVFPAPLMDAAQRVAESFITP